MHHSVWLVCGVFTISKILQVLFKSLSLTSYQSLQSTVTWISFKEIFEKVFFSFG